ncbi:hypothetical protein SmJEL517_g05363 [Synchytrium microbalum]|uniref:C2H2-type domain-containing protein n=1 Tax=Synchytrium microbalum TaxID=1806994 RepID=A0A507BZJ9_9FUNG|nr:uncharacterized protein SmJEL517_g05363 [Synchytrium microbalum]TPX31234.1 hypothetical protein SmJEL517_g05363 [Synchytrium microbalum]
MHGIWCNGADKTPNDLYAHTPGRDYTTPTPPWNDEDCDSSYLGSPSIRDSSYLNDMSTLSHELERNTLGIIPEFPGYCLGPQLVGSLLDSSSLGVDAGMLEGGVVDLYQHVGMLTPPSTPKAPAKRRDDDEGSQDVVDKSRSSRGSKKLNGIPKVSNKLGRKRKHAGGNVYECPECRKTFSRYGRL